MTIRARTSALVRWGGGPRTVLLDFVVAGLVAWGGVSETKVPHWPAALAVAIFLALLVRRRWPLATVVVCCGVMLAGANLLPAFVALYTQAARRGPRRWTWLAVVLTILALGHQADVHWVTDWKYVLLAVSVFVLLPLFAGFWMYQRANLLDALRGRAEQAERERDLLAERAVTAERRRIAGEMHDVVAHRVSVIALQAGALTMICEDERASEAAEVIRTNSTAALSELRDVLRVLRTEDTEAAPPPGLGGIRQLVAGARSAGVAVELDLPDVLPEASAAIERAAYRVTQEALTNATKHAPGAPVRIVVGARGTGLLVEVTNDRPAAPGSALPGSGYGLVGMRERVELAGGTVHTGPTADGGYRVQASFPRRQDETG